MKASDVAIKLMSEIHNHTDLFSDVLNVVSMNNDSGYCNVITDGPHKMVSGEQFFISGSDFPIDITTLDRTGIVGTLVTNEDHDLTLKITPTITIEGASSATFNGTFNVTDIPNRRTIRFVMLDSGATSATGARLKLSRRKRSQLNGTYKVAYRISDTEFTFESGSNIVMSSSVGKVKTKLRVSASASVERAVDSYTKQELDKCYAFAVLGDTRASQSRDTQNDLVSDIGKSNYYRQIITESVTVVVIGNTKDDIAARRMRDSMVDLLVAITRSIAFYQFPTNFHISRSSPLSFVSHGTRTYNGVLYVHEFIFESSIDMLFQDTVMYDDDVAMRGIDMTLEPDIDGTGFLQTTINLDTEEL